MCIPAGRMDRDCASQATSLMSLGLPVGRSWPVCARARRCPWGRVHSTVAGMQTAVQRGNMSDHVLVSHPCHLLMGPTTCATLTKQNWLPHPLLTPHYLEGWGCISTDNQPQSTLLLHICPKSRCETNLLVSLSIPQQEAKWAVVAFQSFNLLSIGLLPKIECFTFVLHFVQYERARQGCRSLWFPGQEPCPGVHQLGCVCCTPFLSGGRPRACRWAPADSA